MAETRPDGLGTMTFEERVNELRERLQQADREAGRGGEEEGSASSPTWEDDMFKNGWPNCWGDFNNIMC